MTNAKIEEEPVRTVKQKPRIREIKAANLTVDPRVQRQPPSAATVKKLAAELDLNAIGTLTVSERADGSLILLDGQTRRAALLHRGLGDFLCTCAVYSNLTLQQEAGQFRRLNRQRRIGKFEDFDKGRTEGDPVCVEVARIVESHGYRIVNGSGERLVSCVAALLACFQRDGTGDILGVVVNVLRGCYDYDPHALNAHLVAGLGNFIEKNRDVVIEEQLIRKLRARYPVATKLVFAAKGRVSEEPGTSVNSHVTHFIERAYEARSRRS